MTAAVISLVDQRFNCASRHAAEFRAVFEGFDTQSPRQPLVAGSLYEYFTNWRLLKEWALEARDLEDPSTYPDERRASEIYLAYVKDMIAYDTALKDWIGDDKSGRSPFVGPDDFEVYLERIAREFYELSERLDMDHAREAITKAHNALVHDYNSGNLQALKQDVLSEVVIALDGFDGNRILQAYEASGVPVSNDHILDRA